MSWTHYLFCALSLIALAACDVAPVSAPAPANPGVASSPPRTEAQAVQSFQQVVRVMEPVAERECQRRTQGVNCDYRIVVDNRPNLPANAFLTVDKTGRPLIIFTPGLIRETRNSDELAFVMGHEAAHHILGHIERQQANAAAGAIIFAGLASLTGGSGSDIENAQELGALVGTRTFSKEFELEADQLGTVITHRSGFDVLKGAEFFNRIPDPGNQFLGTHPPNAQRAAVVRSTLTQISG